jgi:lipid A disaccharide synthetase
LNIKYVITHTGATEVSLYDATGSMVNLIARKNLVPGYYQEKIDTRNLPSGVYFVVLKQDNEKVSKKFLLIK